MMPAWSADSSSNVSRRLKLSVMTDIKTLITDDRIIAVQWAAVQTAMVRKTALCALKDMLVQ